MAVLAAKPFSASRVSHIFAPQPQQLVIASIKRFKKSLAMSAARDPSARLKLLARLAGLVKEQPELLSVLGNSQQPALANAIHFAAHEVVVSARVATETGYQSFHDLVAILDAAINAGRRGFIGKITVMRLQRASALTEAEAGETVAAASRLLALLKTNPELLTASGASFLKTQKANALNAQKKRRQAAERKARKAAIQEAPYRSDTLVLRRSPSYGNGSR